MDVVLTNQFSRQVGSRIGHYSNFAHLPSLLLFIYSAHARSEP